MTHYFMDTSALIKRYVSEVGTAWIQSLANRNAGNTIFIAQITTAEIVSAAERRKREGTIPAQAAHAVRLLIDRHASREYTTIGLTDEIVKRAEDLLELYPLRGYDAIQLASAQIVNVRLVNTRLPVLTFVTADKRLLTAAVAEGLTVENPDTHP